MKRVATSLIGVLGLVLCAAPAYATTLDLTTAGSDGFINDAFYVAFNPNNVGTGTIDSYVRIQETGPESKTTPNGVGVEDGYNTDGTPQFDTKNGAFTHSITLGQIPIVGVDTDGDGVIDAYYREFLLDLNEDQGHTDELLSLDELQIFLADAGDGSQIPTTFTSGILDINGDLIYRLDGGADGPNSWALLNAHLTSGSGQGYDLTTFVPFDLFLGYPDTAQLYLYAKFGVQGTDVNDTGVTLEGTTTVDGAVADGTFEEWAVRKKFTNPTCEELGTCTCEQLGTCNPPPPEIPEPSSLLLLGSGFASVIGFRARRKRNG